MEKEKISAVGSILTAIGASLCCIGPVLVVLFGIGSIGAFSVFESYRPYLIGFTVVLLGLAFYLTYRKREVVCADGTCKMQSTGTWNKISVWGATLLAAGAIAFPYFGASLIRSAQATPALESETYATVVLKVEGMDCAACAAGLEATLGGIDGVRRAKVEYEKANAVIEYDPAAVQPQKFVSQIQEVGFSATTNPMREEN